MTEQQFTPEYIEFILSDEAKGLQGLWEPAVGDWCWHNEHKLSLIYGTDLPASSETDIASISEEGRLHYIYLRPYLGDVTWLPTLFQLLCIIEGAGWEWERLRDGKWRLFRKDWLVATLACDDVDDDVLAAAKLAVKAVEGKG